MKNEKGVYITPAFPKLLYVLEEDNIHKDSKYEDIYIPLEDRKIRIRVFNDFNDIETHKMIFYIHGGGWVSGDIDYYTNLCNNLSKRTNQIVLLIDYRLAPENPFPCGFNDCYEIAYLLMKNTHLFNFTYLL